jgi:hypothetical protein
MALIPGTLPNDTCYGTPQDLLELFAQYLDVPAFALSSKVVFSTTNTGFTSDIVWFDTTSATRPIMKITVSSSGFLDYVKNYITAAPVVTIVGADSVLILDASDSSNTKRGLVSDIVSLVPITPAKILQVVSTTKTDTFTTTSTSFTDVTGLSVSITPSSASNKILVMCNVNGSVTGSTFKAGLRLLRDSTAIAIGDAAGSRSRGFGQLSAPSYQMLSSSITFLDSPSSTSSVTYKIQLLSQSGSTAVINRTGDDADQAETLRTASSITVMEVS